MLTCIYIYRTIYICIWIIWLNMYFVFGCILGFKHNMRLRGGMCFTFWLVVFCWTRLSRSKCSSIAKADNSFEKEKTKSRTSHRKIRKIESWKVKRLHCQFRKVEKSKSRTVSFSSSRSGTVKSFIFNFEKAKSQKVKKCNGVVLNFEKSKSRKVDRFHF